jgi:TonB family protein
MKGLVTIFLSCLSTILFAQVNVASEYKDSVYTFVEEMPKFPGGDTALRKFLSMNIVYPEKARQNHTEGKVLIKFVVNENGDISNVTVVRGVSPELDAEAVRVIKLLPRFEPAQQNNKLVKAYFNIPMTFKLTAPHGETSDKPQNRQLQEYSFIPSGGGINTFSNQSFIYPKYIAHKHIEGRLVIGYVIKGEEIENIRVIQSLSPEIDSEMVRSIKFEPNSRAPTLGGDSSYVEQSYLFKIDTDALGNMVKDPNFEQGLAELKLFNFKSASKFFQLSIEQFPNDFFGYQYKGVCDGNLFKIGQACKDFRKLKN